MSRYVMGAWDIVKASPVWEDCVHNKTRLGCFRYLGQPSSACMEGGILVMFYGLPVMNA